MTDAAKYDQAFHDAERAALVLAQAPPGTAANLVGSMVLGVLGAAIAGQNSGDDGPLVDLLGVMGEWVNRQAMPDGQPVARFAAERN